MDQGILAWMLAHHVRQQPFESVPVGEVRRVNVDNSGYDNRVTFRRPLQKGTYAISGTEPG